MRWLLGTGGTRGEPMNNDDVLKRLDAILNRIGEMLLASVDSDTEGRPWNKAYLDVRGAPGGDVRLKKWRVQLADGEILAELDSPRKVTSLVNEAYEARDEAFAEKKWWGLLITVYPDRRCEVSFDYDPNCVSTFFDSCLAALPGTEQEPRR
jgi:hypothetical protein